MHLFTSDSVSYESGESLIRACALYRGGGKNEVRALKDALKKGLDPNSVHDHGKTLLMEAAELHIPQAVAALLEAGASVRQTDAYRKDGTQPLSAYTALDYALERYCGPNPFPKEVRATVRLLVNAGASLTSHPDRAVPHLHAALHYDVQTAHMLLDQGVCPLALAEDKSTAFHAALQGMINQVDEGIVGWVDLLNRLKTAGVNPYARDELDETPCEAQSLRIQGLEQDPGQTRVRQMVGLWSSWLASLEMEGALAPSPLSESGRRLRL